MSLTQEEQVQHLFSVPRTGIRVVRGIRVVDFSTGAVMIRSEKSRGATTRAYSQAGQAQGAAPPSASFFPFVHSLCPLFERHVSFSNLQIIF
jgi:hypothetical protein